MLTSVLIIEPDPVQRSKMMAWLSFEASIQVMAMSRDLLGGLEAASPLDMRHINVVITNLDSMVDMREWALLRIALPRAYIIGITEGKDKRIILGALAAGLSGILRPCSAKKHFLHAIEEATRERKFVDPYLAERAKLALGQLAKQSPPYCNGIVLDQEGHHATCQGRSICLTPTEAKVLNYLASNPGRIVSARELLESVWQCDLGSGGTMNQVWQCISRIRRKLKREFQHLVFIRTVRGQGYMLVQHAARISHPAFPEICQELAG